MIEKENRPVIAIITGPGEKIKIIDPGIPLLSKGGGCFGYGPGWPDRSEHQHFLSTHTTTLPKKLSVISVEQSILPIPYIRRRHHFTDNGEERLKTREPAVSLNSALREKILAGDNPYRRLVEDPPQCRTDKGFLAELVGCLAAFFPDIAYQKKVFPIEDRAGIEQYFLEILEAGKEPGIATCSIGGAGKDPYWAGKTGIRTEKDVFRFFDGDKGNQAGLTEAERAKYWWTQEGFTRVANRLNLQELIITSHQKGYGEDSRHYVARVRREPNGSFYLEFRPWTWRFRDLEGSIERKDLIKGEISPSGISKINFGESYLKPTSRGQKNSKKIPVKGGFNDTFGYQDIVVSWVQNLLTQFHYLATGDPDINAYYDVLQAFGLDETVEFIGMDNKAKIYEVR